MALFLKDVVDQVNTTVGSLINGKVVSFDKDTGLIYFENEYIVCFEIGKGPNWGVKDKLDTSSSVKKKCGCNNSELYLISSSLKISEFGRLLNNLIRNSPTSLNLIGFSYHHLLYSPGDDDPPLPRKPTSANFLERKESDKGPKGKFNETEYKEFENRSRNLHNNNLVTLQNPIVAILDTGIDLYYWENETCPLYFVETSSCDSQISGSYGWNYVENSYGDNEKKPFDDDELNKHGTRIAKIIANQCKNNVRLLPIKVFDYKGNASFFDIFCAFEFCIQHHVNIINASWGYYGMPFDLFEKYINILSEKKIWFVNAAGNTSDFARNVPLDIEKINEGLTNGHDFFKRYPACYGGIEDNKVITVTTVAPAIQRIKEAPSYLLRAWSFLTGKKNKIQYREEVRYKKVENYSDVHVNVGVAASFEGEFKCPISNEDENVLIKGSSYATAHFVGIFASKQSLLNSQFKREVINAICNEVEAYASQPIYQRSIGVKDKQVVDVEPRIT